MTLRLAYPHDRRSMEPWPLRAEHVWRLADEVRRQFVPRAASLRVDLDRLIGSARRLLVNGIEMTVHWDLNRPVRDAKGDAALAVTEADPALPGALVISLNAELIAERDYLRRSTLAHELGHALFDGPAMVRKAAQAAFSPAPPADRHLGPASHTRGRTDWREFRANEFMGALLVQRAPLQRELLRRAISLGLRLFDVGEKEPVLRVGDDPMRAEELLLDLGERFGVSPEFIEYRLHRYRLIR